MNPQMSRKAEPSHSRRNLPARPARGRPKTCRTPTLRLLSESSRRRTSKASEQSPNRRKASKKGLCDRSPRWRRSPFHPPALRTKMNHPKSCRDTLWISRSAQVEFLTSWRIQPSPFLLSMLYHFIILYQISSVCDYAKNIESNFSSRGTTKTALVPSSTTKSSIRSSSSASASRQCSPFHTTTCRYMLLMLPIIVVFRLLSTFEIMS